MDLAPACEGEVLHAGRAWNIVAGQKRPSHPRFTMADTYLSLRMHLVWATKNRRPWLDPEWRPRLFACIETVLARKGGKLICAGGIRDHLHLYIEPPST